MSFCCEGIELAVENINKKGLSISSSINSQGNLVISLVFRSHDMADDEKFTNLISCFKDSEEVLEFYTQIERVILYCPWCGKKLSKKYKDVFEAQGVSRDTC